MDGDFFANGKRMGKFENLVVSTGDRDHLMSDEDRELASRGIIKIKVSGCSFRRGPILVSKDFMKHLKPEYQSELESARLWRPTSGNISPTLHEENIKYKIPGYWSVK